MTDGSSQAPGGETLSEQQDRENVGQERAPTDRGSLTQRARDAAREEQVKQAPLGFTVVGFFVGFTRHTRFTRGKLREVGLVLDALRAPLGVSLLGAIIFAIPGQIYEIYRLMAEDFSFKAGFTLSNLRFASFFFMLYISGYAIWYVARVLTLTNDSCRSALQERDIDGTVARWGPRFMGALPAFAAAIGMARAEFLRDGDFKTEGLYGAAAIAFLIGVLRLWSSWRRTHHDPQLYDNLRRSWLRIDVRLVLTLLLLGGIAYLLMQPIDLVRWIGALSIICFFMTALVFGWAQLTYVYDRYAVPVLTILIASVFVWSSLDLNDNHFARPLKQVRPLTEAGVLAAGEPEASNASADAGAAAETEQQDPSVIAAGLLGVAQAETSPDLAAASAENASRWDLLTVETAFREWYDTRADREAYESAGKPYPVYIVAAQGGGLYAAYQASLFLAMLQDACPTFSQHIFAISGVSGGAVGASIFTGQVLESGQNGAVSDASPCGVSPTGAPTNLADQADEMMRDDFLSPVISGLLFGDFTARFSPVPISRFDRARALELAFEGSWRRAEKNAETRDAEYARVQSLEAPRQIDEEDSNPLQEGLLSYWKPDGAAPALLYNTSAVETGERLILSPIPNIGEALPSYAMLARRDSDGMVADMRLSTAMILSARFPYITPAGSIELEPTPDGKTPSKLRVVDGGYFENSGIETAFDVMNELGQRLKNRRRPEQITADPNASAARVQRLQRLERVRERQRRQLDVDFRMIVFDLTEDRAREPSYALGELLSPVKAILNSRASRSALAQDRARRQLDSECRYILFGGDRSLVGGGEYSYSQVCPLSTVRDEQVWSVSLNDYEYDFQLGWILSQDTLARIRRQLGDPASCGQIGPSMDDMLAADMYAETGWEEREKDDLVRRHNSCVGRFILDQLRREG